MEHWNGLFLKNRGAFHSILNDWKNELSSAIKNRNPFLLHEIIQKSGTKNRDEALSTAFKECVHLDRPEILKVLIKTLDATELRRQMLLKKYSYLLHQSIKSSPMCTQELLAIKEKNYFPEAMSHVIAKVFFTAVKNGNAEATAKFFSHFDVIPDDVIGKALAEAALYTDAPHRDIVRQCRATVQTLPIERQKNIRRLINSK